MRILQVELQNIKSYSHVTVPLGEGTIAIRGHNGAGKSTLVEAIGYALFDALSYDQTQFVREGERSGAVTVTILSALDDREYQVVRRCGGAATWYVYDPALGGRVAEQKVDVTDFLRKHLRIETEIPLRDLFNDALGVPQGAFTADFLLTPTNRKKKFDALLQVEDYRRASDKLAETRGYLQDQQRAEQKRIDDLERETNPLDGWRAELAQWRERERALVAKLAAMEQAAAQVEARRAALKQQADRIAQLDTQEKVAAANAAAANAALAAAQAQVDEARAAARALDETRDDYAAYLRTEQRLTEARARQVARDGLLARHARLAQDHAGAQRDAEHLRTRLEEAFAAERALEELRPKLQRQERLEGEREGARRDARELEEVGRALAKGERELSALAQQIAEAEREIARLDAQRPLAAQLDEARERVTMLQEQRARRSEWEKRLAKATATAGQKRWARDEAAGKAAKAREQVRKLLDSAAVAARVPELEEAHTLVEAEARAVEARLSERRLAREQSIGGNCPFLREPCLNIRQRGEQNLNAYFDRLILADEDALTPLRAQLENVAKELDHARTVSRYYDQLDAYQERRQHAEEALDALDAELVALAEEREELTAKIAACPDERALAEAQQRFRQSDDADRTLRELAPRQAELRRAQTRQAETLAEVGELRARRAALAAAPETLRAIETQLGELGDLRGASARLAAVVGERPQRERQAHDAQAKLETLAGQVATLDEHLRPYARLDDELAALGAEEARARPGHQRYVQHERLAERLPEREAALASAGDASQTATRRHAAARQALTEAQASFDPRELQRVSDEADRLNETRGRATEELRQTQERSAAREAEIRRAEGLLDELRAARDEQEALAETERMLQQFRDTIKEAGPFIMKALLRQVSVEANRIFGEILGDRSAQLSWEADYEIVLRRDGKARSFAQLSGGEQMSAALAVRLALLRNLTRLNIAFFDEPTQNMDGERRSNLAEQIRRVRGFEQLIVISHDDTFEQGLDSVIHLEKRNGQTVLVDSEALISAS